MTWNFTGFVAGKRITSSGEGVYQLRDIQSQLATRDDSFGKKLAEYNVGVSIIGPDDVCQLQDTRDFSFDVQVDGGAMIRTGFGGLLVVQIFPGADHFKAFSDDLDKCIGSGRRLASFTIDVPAFMFAENNDEEALQQKGSFVAGERAILAERPIFHVVGRAVP